MQSPPFNAENDSLSSTHFMASSQLLHLRQAISSALRNPYPDPWLPDLTTSLIAWAAETLRVDTGIAWDDYGTERVLAGSAKVPRLVAAQIPVEMTASRTVRQVTVEFLTKASMATYGDIGLCFGTPNEITNSAILECLEGAFGVLASIPSLQATVTELIRTCHVLKSQCDSYDVSHSEPGVPFSVFVSVPQSRGRTSTLRVAEALVHEAMHLQLTLIERLVPLVDDCDQRYYSPWKAAWRPARGVLHALYVFRVLDQSFERLLKLQGWCVADVDHLRRRRGEIRRQISEVEAFRGHPALTDAGACFAELLILGDGANDTTKEIESDTFLPHRIC